MAMGEAVGVAAAMCSQRHSSPRDLNVQLLQEQLLGKGIDLFSE